MTREVDWEIEAHELLELELDLSKAPLRIKFGAEKATRRGARLIDAAMTQDAAGHVGNWFGIPGTEYVIPLEKAVSHEMTGRLSAEIGIEDRGVGKLGHIIAGGSVNNPPAYDWRAGPARVMPKVEQGYADEAEDAAFGQKGYGQ